MVSKYGAEPDTNRSRQSLKGHFQQGQGAVRPTDPGRDIWYAEPQKVFDNLYFLGTKFHTAWALTTSDGIIVIDAQGRIDAFNAAARMATLAAGAAPDWRRWRRAAYVTSWILWVALLAWLRHIYPPLGWLGLILLTGYCALFPFVWLLVVRWIFPACRASRPR